MKKCVINTLIANDFGLYKIGEYLIVERLIIYLMGMHFKVYIIIDSNNYSEYKEIIKKYQLEMIFNDEKVSAERAFKGYFEETDEVVFINSNVYLREKNIFEGLVIIDSKEKYIYECNKLKQDICFKHMDNGVVILDVNSTYIGENVMIGKGTVIYPNNYIIGDTCIGENVSFYSNCCVCNSIIGNSCEIGPFSNLKHGSFISDNCIIGAFVEVKNSVVKRNVKAKHHSYLGDVEIDKNCNIGCGVIFANYDGKKKHKSFIGKNSFIGSNVTVVSPVNIGENVVIAAGSTIVNDIGDYTLAIARQHQINKVDYYK